MARARKSLAAQIDVAHLISAGVLASVCPRTLIEEVLAARVRQLNAQVVDCYEPWFKNVYYKRESCCG